MIGNNRRLAYITFFARLFCFIFLQKAIYIILKSVWIQESEVSVAYVKLACHY